MIYSFAADHDIVIPPMAEPTADSSGHVPVMLAETIKLLKIRPGGCYLDATFGGGGHTSAILEQSEPDGIVVALDADPMAIQRAELLAAHLPGRLFPKQGNFREMRSLSQIPAVGDGGFDGILTDLGLSSFQLDDDGRGFSFRSDAPLDMRFDPSRGQTAAVLVNTLPADELIKLLFEYGEEPKARRIVRAILARREQRSIRTARELADLIESAVGGRRDRSIHPATKVFQALRIAVNDELGALRVGLEAAIDLLQPGGRLAVIAFHSLEDRVVKQLLRQEARGCICPPDIPICVCGHQARLTVVTSKPRRPEAAEVQRNPRSRSARLRVAERLP